METLDRVTELSMLYEISGLPTRLKDLDKIAGLAVDKAARLLGGDVAVCYLYQPQQKVLHPQAARGARAQRLADVPLAELPEFIQQAIAQKRPLAWDATTGTPAPNLLGPRYPLQAAISVPLRVEEELLGLIYAVRLQPRPFSVSELTLYGVLADRVASAVADARSYQLLERRVSELQVLNVVGRVLASSLELDELLANLQAQVNAVLDAESFFVTLLDEEDSETWVTALELERGQRQPIERHARHAGLTGYIIQTGMPLLFTTQAELEMFLREHGIAVNLSKLAHSWLGVPIEIGQQIVGVMAVQSYEHAHRYDADDRRLLATIASQAAVALDNARLLAQMRRAVDESTHRAMRLRAATEVAETISAILDLETLLPQIVQVIQTHFELYYAGLFLVDETRQWAVLKAGTGTAGAAMIAAGHRLELGGDSMIGRALAEQRARIALDVGEEAVHFSNPHLPDTRSEMALPLIGREGAIGAMTIQSTRENAFASEDIAVLQTLANQVAVAIDNARLFAESQAALEEAVAVQQRYFGQAWREYLRETPLSGYRQTHEGTQLLVGPLLPEVQQVLGTGGQSLIESDPAGAARLVVPIKLRDQLIGALGFREATARAWTEDEIALAETVAEQFALAAENLRLLDETQRRAAQERLISTVTAEIRKTLEVDTVLQTAVEQIVQVMGLKALEVRLGSQEELLKKSA